MTLGFTLVVSGFDKDQLLDDSATEPTDELPFEVVAACKGCSRTKRLVIGKNNEESVSIATNACVTDTQEIYVLQFPTREHTDAWLKANAAKLVGSKIYLTEPNLPPPPVST